MNSTSKDTTTTAISTSIGQISSAYSLLWVNPIGRVTAASTITSCQPQNTNDARPSDSRRTWQVRCTTCRLVANNAQPPNANLTAKIGRESWRERVCPYV